MPSLPYHISCLGYTQDIKQVWYADDAVAASRLPPLRSWLHSLTSSSPTSEYHVTTNKTWLITKEQHLSKAKELFCNTEVHNTSQGIIYLGTALGLEDFIRQHVTNNVNAWKEEQCQLATLVSS